jgi:hypothetical protein
VAVTEKGEVLPRHGITLLIGLIIVFLAVINFYFILKGVYGRFTAQDLYPNFASLNSLFASHKQKAAILNSNYTKNLLPAGSTWLEDNLKTWEKFTTTFDYDYDIINDNYIETKTLSSYDLIILPGSKSLSDKEIIKIKKYLENGGNILATSGTASYSNDGKWRGWDFFSEVFGIKFSKEIKSEDNTKVHTLRGGFPVTANIPSGYALKVATWDRPIAAEVLDPRAIQLSYWYDYKSEKGLVREEIKTSAGIVSGEYGKGRFIWMGFEVNSIIGLVDNHVYLERLLKNSFNWLCRNPIVYVRDWPNGFNSAAIFLPHLGDNLSPTPELINLFKKKQISPTFVVNQNQIINQNKVNLNQLSQQGEIVPEISFGIPLPEGDTSNNFLDAKSQFEIINDVKIRYEVITGKELSGVMPNFGLFDKNTLNTLTNLNFQFLISDSTNGNSLPKILYSDKGRIVGIFNSSHDDYEVVKKYGLSDYDLQFYTYQEDIDRILFEGGLYIFESHYDSQLRSENFQIISNVIDDLRKKNYWISTASEISKWFSTRNDIEVSIKKVGNKRVRLTAFNTGKSVIESIEIDADLSEKVKNISLSTEIIGTKLPRFKKLNGGSLIRLSISNLEPNESIIYYIDYDADQNTLTSK